tara:strand:- start:1662 stop:2432 length:771 start_codon:yes stop_codon:yes gene_type:complete
MRKIIFLITFLFLIPIAFSATSTLQNGESSILNGREIKIVGIQESKVIVSVDGVKNIVSLDQERTINGVEILITEIFYAGELSTTTLDFNLGYSCGDNSCDVGETSENCCIDCGCTLSSEICNSKSVCIIPECSFDTDCNDYSELTEDYCSDSICKHRDIKCKEDLDCNDNDPDTDDTCFKRRCRNLLNYVCKTDIDCEDKNPCTTDLCIDKDCKNTLIADCDYEPPEEEETTPNTTIEKKGFLIKFFSWLANIFG